MGDQEHGVALLVEIAKQRQHFLTGLGVERAGGLVGEQQGRLVGERAGDRHALALAAGERAGQHVGLLGDAHPLQQLEGAPAALAARHAGVEHGQLDVAHDRRLGQQVVLLEDEAHLLVADRRQLGAAQALDLLAVEREAAAGGPVEAAEDRHQRALAGTRRPDQRHELAARDVEIDSAQSVHRGAVGAVDLFQVSCLNNRIHVVALSRPPPRSFAALRTTSGASSLVIRLAVILSAAKDLGGGVAQLSSSFSTFLRVTSSSATWSPACEAGQDLHPLQGGDAALNRDRLEVVLPVLGQPDELAAALEGLARLFMAFLGSRSGLQPVDDGLALAPLQRLERDRERTWSRCSPRISTLALMPVRNASSSWSSAISTSKTLIFSTTLAAGATKRTLPSKVLLRVGVERHAHRLADVHLGDVDLVEVDLDEQRLEVGDGEHHRALVERRHAGGHGLAELDALGDHHAGHRRGDARDWLVWLPEIGMP